MLARYSYVIFQYLFSLFRSGNQDINQLPNLFIATPRICNFMLLFLVWVRSFSKMLLSLKFAEDRVLVFVIRYIAMWNASYSVIGSRIQAFDWYRNR